MIFQYAKYYSTQALEEGFIPKETPGKQIFYRTSDWNIYKSMKGHDSGNLSVAERERAGRHAQELHKIFINNERIISLGGGTGQLEKHLAAILNINITIADIYPRTPSPGINHILLDMTDLEAVRKTIEGYSTIIISNAMSPLIPSELFSLLKTIAESNVSKIVIYSAEDLRIINAISSFLKKVSRLCLGRQAMWLGYLYNGKYIKKIIEKYGFNSTIYIEPVEHGILTPIWGSVYLAVLSRGEALRIPLTGVRIQKQKLLM